MEADIPDRTRQDCTGGVCVRGSRRQAYVIDAFSCPGLYRPPESHCFAGPPTEEIDIDGPWPCVTAAVTGDDTTFKGAVCNKRERKTTGAIGFCAVGLDNRYVNQAPTGARTARICVRVGISIRVGMGMSLCLCQIR
jgi:hypothetical protein